jgi:DNA-directed RNA polymerase specialized sigma24 family protein
MRTKTIDDYLRMLRNISWKYARQTGEDPDDIYGEACLAFTRAMVKYDAQRAQVSTFVYHAVTNHLKNKMRNEKNRPWKNTEVYSLKHPVDLRLPSDAVMFLARLQSMSKPARAICKRILETPDTFSNMKCNELYQHLRKQGMHHRDIHNSFQEIKTTLREQ